MSPQVLAELLGKPVSLNDLLFLLLPHIFTPFYVPEIGKDVKKTTVAPVLYIVGLQATLTNMNSSGWAVWTAQSSKGKILT